MPHFTAFLDRLGEFTRLICYDKRGTGVSDRLVEVPTLEERAEDVLAVLDELDVEQAAMFGISEGESLAAYVGATHPDRVSSVVVWGTASRFVRDEDHPWGWATSEEMATGSAATAALWGSVEGARANLALQGPSMSFGDDELESYARLQRASLSRDAVLGHFSIGSASDLSRLLERPGCEVHALDLSAPEGALGLAPAARTAVIDDRARDDYRRHLHATIRTGTYCAYQPDPVVRWHIDR